jgi:ankyrin repeat protein
MTDLSCQDTHATQSVNAEKVCREALFVTDPAADRRSLIDKNGDRVLGTCEWIEDNEIYRSWLCGDPGLIWIFGGPGTGKTMLSIYLTQESERQHSAETIYFFCSSAHPTRSTATAVLRTLLWQMILKRPETAKIIILSTPGSLWEIFVKVIQSGESGKLRCLIDGLDECDAESSRWLTSQFGDWSRHTNNAGLHVAIICRHMSSVKDIRQIHLDPDNDQNIGNDIKKFTKSKMHDLSQRLDLSASFCARIQAELIKKSEGTFLWIGYAMLELFTKSTSFEVEEVVKDLPAALPALYSRMLRRIPSNKLKLVTKLLHWVTLAVRPLYFAELADTVADNVSEYMDKWQALRDLIKLCEPLIAVQHDRVSLLHQSARDYLLREEEDVDEFAESVRATFINARLSLARSCLDALERSTSLSAYARFHWPHHMRQCSKTDQVSMIVREPFFGEKSIVRDSWWMHSSGDLNAPRLHMACYIGLRTWAEIMLVGTSDRDPKQERWPRLASVVTKRTATQPQQDLINNRTGTGMTPLHYAVLGAGDPDTISFLLTHGADLDGREAYGSTSLSLAVDQSMLETTKLLLANGADPDGCFRIDGSVGQTPLCKIIDRGPTYSLLAELLVGAGADLQAAARPRNSRNARDLVAAATRMGSVSLVQRLLDSDFGPSTAEGELDLLRIAAGCGHGEVVSLLLDRTTRSKDFSDACEDWPIYAALVHRNLSIAHTIICYGATPSDTLLAVLPLWAAILNNNVADVCSALGRGNDPNIATLTSPGCPGGLTSLHWAIVVWNNHLGANGIIFRRLLEHGANPDLRDAEGKTALQHARHAGKVWKAASEIVAQSRRRVHANMPGVDCNLDLLRTGGSRR